MASFEADSTLVTRALPSPNHGERRGGARPDMIILHYTGTAHAGVALDVFASAESQLSAHYVISEDGLVTQCVAEARRAWHAGVSIWAGETDINSYSIGIEVANPGHEFGYPDFGGAQIASVIALCRDIAERHDIAPCAISWGTRMWRRCASAIRGRNFPGTGFIGTASDIGWNPHPWARAAADFGPATGIRPSVACRRHSPPTAMASPPAASMTR